VAHTRQFILIVAPRVVAHRASSALLKAGLRGTGLGCGDGGRCPCIRLELIFCGRAVERLAAAFDAVLELSIPRRKLSNDMVWTRRSLPRWISLAEAHQAPRDEAVPGRFVFVRSSHVKRSLVLVKRQKLGGHALGEPASWS
jgi:hypothetical protein